MESSCGARSVFLGTVKRTSKLEKKADDPHADVFFQKNAWADSEFCVAWAKTCFRMRLMQGRDGVLAEESLLTLHNLHGRTTDKFMAYMKKECNSLVYLYPGWCKDARQPIDADRVALASRLRLGTSSTFGFRTMTVWNGGKATRRPIPLMRTHTQ